jgi:hypothetical protein
MGAAIKPPSHRSCRQIWAQESTGIGKMVFAPIYAHENTIASTRLKAAEKQQAGLKRWQVILR